MFIGVISDTHGVFSQEFRDFLAPVDEIWHAGDFGGSINFADSIAAFKPLKGVYGNCDGQDIRLVYPEYQCFECEDKRVLIMHIGGRPGRYDYKARALMSRYHPDIFVVKNDPAAGVLYINPGACGIQGWHVERTALRFHIDDGDIHGMELFHEPRTLQNP